MRKANPPTRAQRLLVLSLGKAQHHDGHHQGVVRAEQAFEGDEECDGDEIGGREVQEDVPS
jgi:hypothetical protein